MTNVHTPRLKFDCPPPPNTQFRVHNSQHFPPSPYPRALLHKARLAPECGAQNLFRTAWSPFVLFVSSGPHRKDSTLRVCAEPGGESNVYCSCQDPTRGPLACAHPGSAPCRGASVGTLAWGTPGLYPIQPSHSATSGYSLPAPALSTKELEHPHHEPAPPSLQSLLVTMITAGMLTGKALTENGDGITPGTQTIWRTPRLPAAGKLAQSSREIYGYEPGIQLFSREFLKKKKEVQLSLLH